MSSETIAVAADHAGFRLKSAVKTHLAERGFAVLDLGTDGTASVDYPDFAAAMARALADRAAARGVLACGSGIGMSIAANRFAGVRAALVHDAETARLARRHNDANVMVLGGRLIDRETALSCLDVFLSTAFDGGRHERRLEKIA